MLTQKNSLYFQLLFFLTLFSTVLSPALAGQETKKRLLVIGVTNEIKDKAFNDQLIGFGMSRLLLQKLFDTGRFTPVEDNPEILDNLQKMIRAQWTGENLFTPKKRPGPLRRRSMWRPWPMPGPFLLPKKDGGPLPGHSQARALRLWLTWKCI